MLHHSSLCIPIVCPERRRRQGKRRRRDWLQAAPGCLATGGSAACWLGPHFFPQAAAAGWPPAQCQKQTQMLWRLSIFCNNSFSNSGKMSASPPLHGLPTSPHPWWRSLLVQGCSWWPTLGRDCRIKSQVRTAPWGSYVVCWHPCHSQSQTVPPGGWVAEKHGAADKDSLESSWIIIQILVCPGKWIVLHSRLENKSTVQSSVSPEEGDKANQMCDFLSLWGCSWRCNYYSLYDCWEQLCFHPDTA